MWLHFCTNSYFMRTGRINPRWIRCIGASKREKRKGHTIHGERARPLGRRGGWQSETRLRTSNRISAQRAHVGCSLPAAPSSSSSLPGLNTPRAIAWRPRPGASGQLQVGRARAPGGPDTKRQVHQLLHRLRREGGRVKADQGPAALRRS